MTLINNNYFLKNGHDDHLRLSILNRLYNPKTIAPLKDYGLKPGMTILEYGCGMGILATELAKYLGPTGRVIAVDFSEESLQVARENAKYSGVTNIDFIAHNVENIGELDVRVDFAYGRYTLIWSQIPDLAIAGLCSILKPGGTLVCEELNFADNGNFSYPHEPLVNKYFEISFKNSICTNLPANLASSLYRIFKQTKLQDLQITSNQGIATTPEDRSLYRLGLVSMYDSLLKHKIFTETELVNLIAQYAKFEQTDIIAGFFRNLIVSGVKPKEPS